MRKVAKNLKKLSTNLKTLKEKKKKKNPWLQLKNDQPANSDFQRFILLLFVINSCEFMPTDKSSGKFQKLFHSCVSQWMQIRK